MLLYSWLPRVKRCGDVADTELAKSDVIQTGHIWFFELAVCFWVLGLPLFKVELLYQRDGNSSTLRQITSNKLLCKYSKKRGSDDFQEN